MTEFSVLVAEPDAAQRQIIEMLLLVHGGEVSMVLDAREALAYLQVNTPDLIIAAMDLPQMSGFNLSRRARGIRRLRDVPVIITAPEGTVHSQLRAETERSGADLLLVKPLGDKNLGERAADLVSRAAEGTAASSDRLTSGGTRSGRFTPVPDLPPADARGAAPGLPDPLNEGLAGPESDEIRKLRLLVADLSAENETLRKQLTATGRQSSGGLGIINELREELAQAEELLENYRSLFPNVEGGRSFWQRMRRKP